MELANNYIAILDEVSKKFGLAIDWTQQNIQPYMQELVGRVVKYELFTSIIWIALCVVLIVLGIKIFHSMSSDGYVDEGDIATMVALFILPSIGIMFQLFDIVRCITLPELVFLNMVQQFMQ